MRRPLPSLTVLILTLAVAPPLWSQSDPWSVLREVRESLVEAGPTEARFVQVYVPAGFTSGEQESGTLAFSLPDCLRWDYAIPYPKSFLLCGGVAHAWNAEDKTGRRYRVDRRNEPGLDLLLLSVDDLKSRYRATRKAADGGRVEIALVPQSAQKTPQGIAEATLVVDPATDRLVEVSYRDPEGNRTRFEITGYRTLKAQGQFNPPRDVDWTEGREASRL